MDDWNWSELEEISKKVRSPEYIQGIEDGIIMARHETLGVTGLKHLEEFEQIDKTFEYLLQQVRRRKMVMLCAFIEDIPEAGL